jgi:hypothetical protein
MVLFTSNQNRWIAQSTGHFITGIDNVYDIGAVGATRPRTIYAGTSVVTPLLDSAVQMSSTNTVEQRNGTNAQTLNIYATYTDASNYRRLRVDAGSGFVGLEGIGTGSVGTNLTIDSLGTGSILLRTNATARWFVHGSLGSLWANTDNTYDIGSGGANRPRSIYAGTSVVTPLLDAPLITTAGNAVEQRNGTNVQLLRIYNTYTDASNYERLVLQGRGAPGLGVTSEKAGTGTNTNLSVYAGTGGNLNLGGNGNTQWLMQTAGLLPAADNTYDIGGANRCRNVLASGAVATGGKAGAALDGDVTNAADGMLRYDSTNLRLYVRIGGTWRYAALT